MPILTIIIPSYKTAAYIDECLPTFIDDRLSGKIRILLIDDGSPDVETISKLKSYSANHPDLFEYVHKENAGHGSVINLGSVLVNTRYFKVIDGDDWTNPDGLLSFASFLEESNDDLVLSDFTKIVGNSHTLIKPGCSQLEKTTKIPIHQIENYDVSFHSVTINSDFWKQNRIKVREHVFYEDQEYCLFPLEYAKTFGYCPADVYQYRLGRLGQSVSPSSYGKHYKDLSLVQNDLYLLYQRTQPNSEVSHLVGKHLVSSFQDTLYSAIYSEKDSRAIKREKEQRVKDFYKMIRSDEYLYACLDKKRKLFRVAKLLRFKHLGFLKPLLNKYCAYNE